MAPRFERAHAIIEGGLASRAYPAATIEAGRGAGPLWTAAFGRLTYDADSPACALDTVFDLASLTKVIATASLAMRAHAEARLPLETSIADLRPAWRDADRREVTVRHLLDHSSGLPAHLHLWERGRGRDLFEREIAATALEQPPGARAVYSDLGFMLLGFLLEDAGGAALDTQFEALARRLGLEIRYRPPTLDRATIAPTEVEAIGGRLIQGTVHDENAAALGGVAAHAGLFGAAGAVGRFARAVLATFQRETPLGDPSLMRRFAAPTGVPGSSRALGWDTMRPTSSCGTRMSPAAIGHTGFTGTSLWIDPDQDLYVAFLTNRVHPTRENNQLIALRPALHDAIAEAIAPM